MTNTKKKWANRKSRAPPRHKSASNNRLTIHSKKLRERLYKCQECDSMNTRININGSRLKCLDCGIIANFKEDQVDRKAMWEELLKITDLD